MGAQFAWLTAADGTRLRTVHWPSPAGPLAQVIVFQTGRTEFIEKCYETVHDLLDRGFAVFMMDWRGQGLSDRALPDRHKGHVESYDLYLSDFHQFVTDVVLPTTDQPLMLLAHSMGGHITLRYLHDHPEHFAAAIFTGPMIDLGMPRPLRPLAMTIARLTALFASRHVYSLSQSDYDPDAPFEGNGLTTDPDRFADMAAACHKNADLALGGATVGWIIETLASIRILNDESYLRAIKTPVLVQYGSEDRLVSTKAIRRAAEVMPNASLLKIAGAKHEMLKEQDDFQDIFWHALDDFIEDL